MIKISKIFRHLLLLVMIPVVAVPFFLGLEVLFIVAQANNQKETDQTTQERYKLATEGITKDKKPYGFDEKIEDIVKDQQEKIQCMQTTGLAEYDKKTVGKKVDGDNKKLGSSDKYKPIEKPNCDYDLAKAQKDQKKAGFVAASGHPDGHKTTMGDKNNSMNFANAATNLNAKAQIHNEFVQNCRSCALASYCANGGEGSHACSETAFKGTQFAFLDYFVDAAYASVRSDPNAKAYSQLQISTAIQRHRQKLAAINQQLTDNVDATIEQDHQVKKDLADKGRQMARNTAANKQREQNVQLTEARSAFLQKMGDRITTDVSGIKTGSG